MKQQDLQEDAQVKQTGFLRDVKVCLSFLTRLPAGKVDQNRQLGDASAAFGVVGLVIGVLCGLVFWICSLFGLNENLASIFAVLAGLIATGAMHEDGLADSADSFGGWGSKRKLEIMRDSHIGTYGVLALIVGLAIKIFALSEILAGNVGLLASVCLFGGIAIISRAGMALLMYQLPLARKDGHAVTAGRPSHDTLRKGLVISAACGFSLLFLAVGLSGVIMALLTSIAVYAFVYSTTKRLLGGYSGDVLGALQQITEIASLVALTALV